MVDQIMEAMVQATHAQMVAVETIVALLIKVTFILKFANRILRMMKWHNNRFPELPEGCTPMVVPMVGMKEIPEVHRSQATACRPSEPS